MRQYKPLGSRFYFFVDESIGASGSRTTDTIPGNPGKSINKIFDLNLGINPGVACSVTHHFLLETGLQNMFSINYTHNSLSGGGHINSFGASTAFSQVFDNLYLGARFLFGN